MSLDPRAKRLEFANGVVARYDRLVSSVPIPELVRRIPDTPADVADAARRLACSTCVLVNLGVDREDLSSAHMSYFYDEDVCFTRLSFPHMLASSNVPPGTGSVQAETGFSCSRCLKPFRRSLDLPVDVVYHPLEEAGREQHELHDDEMDMGFYQGDEIDLQELVREQVLLNLQMKPLCDELCRGICPKCGADLNESPCGCPQKEADPRFSVLKKLLPEGKE